MGIGTIVRPTVEFEPAPLARRALLLLFLAHAIFLASRPWPGVDPILVALNCAAILGLLAGGRVGQLASLLFLAAAVLHYALRGDGDAGELGPIAWIAASVWFLTDLRLATRRGRSQEQGT